MKRTKILYKSVTNHDLIGLIGLESEFSCISNSYSDMIRDAIKRELNKIGLLLCHSHIELRLWLRLN